MSDTTSDIIVDCVHLDLTVIIIVVVFFVEETKRILSTLSHSMKDKSLQSALKKTR